MRLESRGGGVVGRQQHVSIFDEALESGGASGSIFLKEYVEQVLATLLGQVLAISHGLVASLDTSIRFASMMISCASK
ncbi:MAG: hypothetical protein CMJ80_17905 [Planctomycetaceae bacterium]|nr:hypothetical protein [Planctomycetaceae bacterium]